MAKRIRIKGKLRVYILLFIVLGVIMVAVNVPIYMTDVRFGISVSIFLILYFLALLGFWLYIRKNILEELVGFATQYGQVQKKILYGTLSSQSIHAVYSVLDDWLCLGCFARYAFHFRDECFTRIWAYGSLSRSFQWNHMYSTDCGRSLWWSPPLACWSPPVYNDDCCRYLFSHCFCLCLCD